MKHLEDIMLKQPDVLVRIPKSADKKRRSTVCLSLSRPKDLRVFTSTRAKGHGRGDPAVADAQTGCRRNWERAIAMLWSIRD